MFKSVSELVQGGLPQQAQRADSDVTVKRLFMLFHGWYGALFLSKFATGELDDEGKDRGIKSARMVWSSELRLYPEDVIRSAADRCKTEHPKYPPSLPEFAALCKATMPRKTMRETNELGRLGISGELRSEYSRQVREQANARLQERKDAAAGTVHVSDGLDGLKQLIAHAAALAGGDEAGELARLDRLLFKRVS